MTKYVSFLRGINVGGKNIIKMADLKSCLEKGGFENVTTFIQSGNVLFESDEKESSVLEKKIETILDKTFNYTSKVLVRSKDQIKKILDQVPKDWKTRTDIRCYIAFVKEPSTPKQVIQETVLKEGIDFIKEGVGVVYMTTHLSGLTKSGLNKIASTKIYKEITIRNYNTTQKIATLLDIT